MMPRLFIAGGFILIVALVAAFGLPRLSPEQIAGHERSLRSAIETHRASALVIGIAAYSLVALIPGTSGKSIIAGWLFGFIEGLTIVMAGLTAAACVMFFVSRYLLRDAIRGRFSARLVRWDRKLAEESAWFLLSVRWAHSPYTIVNYACGVSSVSFKVFFWTTVAGLLPGSVIFVWMGSRLPTLDRLVQGGMTEFLDPWLWLALAGTAVVPAAVRWYLARRRRIRDRRFRDSTQSHDKKAKQWTAS